MQPSRSYLSTPTETAVPLQELRDICHLRTDTSSDAQLTELCNTSERLVNDLLNRPVRVGTKNDVYDSFSEQLELSETPNADLIIAWYDENHTEQTENINLLGTETNPSQDWTYDKTSNRLVWIGDTFVELSDRFEYPVRVSYGYGGLATDPRVKTALRNYVLAGYSQRNNLPVDIMSIKEETMCLLEPLKRLVM